ncbi:MAG: hypothetical protein CMI55_03905 [Parcubacteria group bacterium]|jgi:hypothetical protein|nr:hypothetical protein [Parcubacteria group bacterium]|tara:strand:+ start:183 stop:791 length:609 start_codon:yes stop_codon:yes gene_type:complete
MKILNEITEDEVTAAILQYNSNSFRFKDRLKELFRQKGLDMKIVTNPDLKSDGENTLRRQFVQSLDGSGIGGYLDKSFPKDVAWKKARLSKEDLQKIKYIDYSYWNELTKNTRLVRDGAKSIKKGVVVFNESNQPFWDAFEALKQGKKFPAPILVTKNDRSDLVVIDGHLRLTVYLLDERYAPDEIETTIGYSENFSSWDLY